MSTDISFSVIIPTWNNLDYLKLCIASIQKNSAFKHEIIVHANESIDGTKEWLKFQKDILFTYSEGNIGICSAVNLSFTKASKSYIVYMNDDMYVLPNWDKYLFDAISSLDDNNFMLSATMIEPRQTNNTCVFVADYGDKIDNFKEGKLLADYKNFEKQNWYGSMWPPNLVHRDYWVKIGGFSEAFSPGMYSDPDFAMKMWQEGCRIFIGIGESKVYHFQSKSTGKIKKNDGKKTFLLEWGISPSTFIKYFLKRGNKYQGEPLSKPKGLYYTLALLKDKIKRLFI